MTNSSVSSPVADCSFRLRVYINIASALASSGGQKKGKDYELFHLTDQSESFDSLKVKVFRKLGLDIKNAPFVYFTLQRLYTVEKGHAFLRPFGCESVYDVVKKEELRWAGSLIVVINDIREEMNHLTGLKSVLEGYEIVDSLSSIDRIGDMIPESTEFGHQNIMSCSTVYSQIDKQSKFERRGEKSIPTQIINEIEVSSLKSGRLLKLCNANGKESYKEMNVILTAGSLWYYPTSINALQSNSLTFQEVVLSNLTIVTANTLDTSCCTFAITVPYNNEMLPNSTCMLTNFDSSDSTYQGVHYIFKAKNSAECQSWVDTIQQRSNLSSENDIIFMADAYTAAAEEETCEQDIDVLVDCTTFEGTLKNGYMREKFQGYLANNFEDESLLFWEYCEDFRKGHPDSKDPFDFSADYKMQKRRGSCAINATSSMDSVSNEEISLKDKEVENVKADSTSKKDPDIVLTWARYISNKFIVDGAPMQIACPSKDRSRIDFFLSSDAAPPDLFYPVQTQIYNQLKFQKFTDFVKCTNFRSVLLSTVMNNINQCQVTGQIWCTISPRIPSKLITSPADFYPSIFPKIDSFELKYALTSNKPVSSNKYSLLAWSPGQYDMPTFNYSDSLKYEIEKDYINNYSKIPLGVSDTIVTEEEASNKKDVQVGRFANLKKSFSMKFGKKNSGHETKVSESFRFTSKEGEELVQNESGFGSHTNPQSIIPTPWRYVGETGDKMSTPPHWMPFYWWRYVNPNVSQTYDQSYVEQMFQMLPDWIKCIVIDKIMVSLESGEVNDESLTENTSLLHNYTHAVSKVKAMRKEDSSKLPIDDGCSDDGDLILHTCSSPTAHGISFTCNGGYESGNHAKYRIKVPHLARLSTFQHQWSTLPIPGRIVSAVYVLASYCSSNGIKEVFDTSRSITVGDMDDEVERPSLIDSPSNINVSQSSVLSNSSRRLCVLSYWTDSESINRGEIRLYGANYCDLYAIIRLCAVIKLSPSTNLMNTIEITDESGAVWHLCPDDLSLQNNCSNINKNNIFGHVLSVEKRDNVVMEPPPSSCRCWLHLLSQFCRTQAYAVYIVHEGYLSKRGRLNTAFRKRWFIMTSEYVLLYYSRSEGAGQSKFKGALNLLDVREVNINENGKDFVIHTSSRDWVLKADTTKEAESWKRVIDKITQ